MTVGTIETVSKKIDVQTNENRNTEQPTENNDTVLIKKVIEKVKCGLRFLWKDLTKTHLLWVKIIFFLQSASLVTLYPYLVSTSKNTNICQITCHIL